MKGNYQIYYYLDAHFKVCSGIVHHSRNYSGPLLPRLNFNPDELLDVINHRAQVWQSWQDYHCKLLLYLFQLQISFSIKNSI
ncbi:hypothetical protein FGO68_gene8793 [Halteria grandinella]|uniref:Uncharacterized protein n=1 Tax=Halteria grandinella TaxID=5974 RepID=A0A8J8P4A0_HALGN|nr:hypothetical protein FGO68_gene8793 [Halteria grandinella]